MPKIQSDTKSENISRNLYILGAKHLHTQRESKLCWAKEFIFIHKYHAMLNMIGKYGRIKIVCSLADPFWQSLFKKSL